MRNMRTVVWPVVFVSLLFALGNGASLRSQQLQDACDKLSFPVEVEQLLAAKFPSWRVLRIGDLADPHDRELWLKGNPKECPGIAAGHFESKAHVSYAALLIPRDLGRPGYRLVVVTTDRKGQYRAVVLEKSDNPIPRAEVVYRVPPGKYFDAQRLRSVQLALDGIQKERMEAGATLYYWKGGQYHRLIVSE